MKLKPWFVSTAVLLGSGTLALAQPAPADAPVAPVEASPPVPPTPATPPAEPAPAPTAVVVPVPVEEPAPAKKDDKPAIEAVYDGGLKFSTSDDSFELKLQFRNQVRFEANRKLDDETPTSHNQFTDRFYLPRTRLQAEGHIFDGDARFKVELGMGDSGNFSFLKDGWVEKRLAPKAFLRAGQWKRPFNRMEMVSDFASTFNERALENELAGGGRDLGIALHNDYEKSPAGIEWVVGMFNGFSGGSDRPAFSTTCTDEDTSITCVNSRPTNFPTDFAPAIVGRVAYNSPKIKGYSESDLDGGPLRYSVGAAYKVDLANFAKGSKDSWADNTKHGLEVDALIKVNGLSVHAGAVLMKIQDADAELGFLIQPGYMVVPKKAEVAGRFSLVTEPDRQQIEARAAFNYYFKGHAWKLATDGGFLQFIGDGAKDDKPDLQFRAMMQLQI